MNTALGLGVPPTAAWLAFRDYMQRTPNCNIGALLKRGTPLSAHEQAMYDAPFAAGEVSKAGVRRFPRLVPITAAHRGTAESRAALAYFQALPPVAHRSNLCDASSPQAQGLGARVGQPLRVFVCCGMADPVLGEPVMRKLADKLWGASTGYHWHAVEEGGHFVQEWCEHVPALVEQAWAGPDPAASGRTQESPHVVEWVAPSSSAKL
ncbi:hypothetical protein FA09DRAFT_336944 [Tilletiopsis washingtonensis]|uniref:Alpha/beta-hydrolase n=1 Tax=Tilletiopsis washingtonensis TaxID=58919 RepID=A0A316ZIG3_9BASI|nr:hypothetical protein FA09DRAFT_336944 [Tilletiopsis washingtonensis]PWO00116.1 hypothetical protein FA09DRAFT_336944 [Tilletiopsis washingtonensis]